jgi:hypothetical protein
MTPENYKNIIAAIDRIQQLAKYLETHNLNAVPTFENMIDVGRQVHRQIVDNHHATPVMVPEPPPSVRKLNPHLWSGREDNA